MIEMIVPDIQMGVTTVFPVFIFIYNTSCIARTATARHRTPPRVGVNNCQGYY